jgi:two-component system response regulator VanR
VNADPLPNAALTTVSGLRKRLGEPGVIATVAGAGYRINKDQTEGMEENVDRTPGLSARLTLQGSGRI